jgi:hypothetical protein
MVAQKVAYEAVTAAVAVALAVASSVTYKKSVEEKQQRQNSMM